MIGIAITFLVLVIFFIVFYVWNFKDAEIEIGVYRGILIGVTHTLSKDAFVRTHYLDICLGIVLISVCWNE